MSLVCNVCWSCLSSHCVFLLCVINTPHTHTGCSDSDSVVVDYALVVVILWDLDLPRYHSYLCGCDLWTVRHDVVLEHVPSLPLSPYFFHQWVIPTFPKIKKKLNVLLNEICTVRVNTIEVHITINIMYMQICMRSQKWVVAIYCNFRWLHCLVWVSHPHGKKKWFTCHWGLLEARWTTSLLSSGRQNITQFFFVNCLDIHILLTTPNYNHVDFQAWSIRLGQINHYLFTR